VASSSSNTRRAEVPVVTELVTQGAHDEGIALIAHFFTMNDKCTLLRASLLRKGDTQQQYSAAPHSYYKVFATEVA